MHCNNNRIDDRNEREERKNMREEYFACSRRKFVFTTHLLHGEYKMKFESLVNELLLNLFEYLDGILSTFDPYRKLILTLFIKNIFRYLPTESNRFVFLMMMKLPNN